MVRVIEGEGVFCTRWPARVSVARFVVCLFRCEAMPGRAWADRFGAAYFEPPISTTHFEPPISSGLFSAGYFEPLISNAPVDEQEVSRGKVEHWPARPTEAADRRRREVLLRPTLREHL